MQGLVFIEELKETYPNRVCIGSDFASERAPLDNAQADEFPLFEAMREELFKRIAVDMKCYRRTLNARAFDRYLDDI